MSSRHWKRMIATFAFAALVASSASAELSTRYKEWGNGPEQWIMTAEEQNAWKAVKTDEEAIDFIDLFWVRRDPTPLTAKNEFHDEFMARVRFSDVKFADRGRRGALTDRGRVFIVLGNPTTSTTALGYASFHSLGTQSVGNPGGGSRLRGGTDTWTWDHDDAAQFDMPGVTVIFVEQLGSQRITRDPRRGDVLSAMPVAIRKAIVNPDITSVPAWAPRGGLDPKILVITETAPATAETHEAPKVTAVIGGGAIPPQVTPDAAVAPSAAGTASASDLTLLSDIFAIEPETNVDPFTQMQPVSSFKAQDDLGWAVRYCASGDDDPLVRFGLRLTGRAGNEVIDRLAPPDEMVPDRMRAVPGCYLLRGAIPLEGMNPGDYELEVSIIDGPAPTVLKKSFRIE